MSADYSTLFWSRVLKSEGCWEWQGYFSPDGVATYRIQGKNRTAYRWALHFSGIEVPKDAWVRMSCGNSRCVRPDHIQVITWESHFWEHVHKVGDCWEWIGARHEFGYGKMTVRNKTIGAHCFSWELHNGPIPKGLCVLHRCDKGACVKPTHLFLGTSQDNVRDMVAKGRQARGENHNKAKLTEGDVREIRAMVASGMTQRKIGKIKGVSHGVVGRIAKREIWAHVH